MINRDKLEHILEYAKQQRRIGQSCKVPPEDMVEIMERLLQAGNSPVILGWIQVSERMPEKNQSVLISVNFDSTLVSPLICSARFTGSTFRRGGATVKPGDGVEHATHWMPLPNPPHGR